MKTVPFSLRAPEEYAERRIKETSHAFRSKFMRDRDRIMYCKAFRRLALKTQIFVNGFDDHTRNRLTHTLEVSQIARTISRVLKLDQDLTEAISLGHDLGHTPFGHVGERTLNLIMNACDPTVRDYFEMGDFGNIILHSEDKGFKHNLQSVRVAVDLESPILNHESGGLNLTNFTLFGIQIHSKLKWSECKYESKENCYLYPKSYACENENILSVGYYEKYEPYLLNNSTNIESWSFEAYVVAWADEIAQRHHDIEDALEGKFITEQGVISLIEKYFGTLLSGKRRNDFIQLKQVIGKPQFLPRLSRFLVDYLVTSLIDISVKNLKLFCERNSIKTNKDFVRIYPTLAIAEIKDIIGFRDYSSNNTSFDDAHDKFQNDLKSIVLNSFSVHRMDGKAKFIIRRLFKAYLTNPQQLPDKTIYALFREYGHIHDYNEIEIGHLRNQLEIFKNPAKNSTLSESMQLMVDFRIALLRIITDYIGGMTDSYAQKEYDKLY